MSSICKKQWEKFGRLPGELFEGLTPSQFVGLLTNPLDKPAFDRIAELTKHNDLRGKRGERPAIPAWLTEGT